MKKILHKITEVRTNRPDLLQYVGTVAELKGNAWLGFSYKMHDGKEADAIHFFYERIKD